MIIEIISKYPTVELLKFNIYKKLLNGITQQKIIFKII